MACDVVKQCAVLKLTDRGHLLSQVLEEGLENHHLGCFVGLVLVYQVPHHLSGGIDPPM
jgi:hypothetical protein